MSTPTPATRLETNPGPVGPSDPVAPAAETVPVTDGKGSKILATPALVDHFVVPSVDGKPGLVITPAGTEVPASKVQDVVWLAARAGVELREVPTA